MVILHQVLSDFIAALQGAAMSGLFKAGDPDAGIAARQKIFNAVDSPGIENDIEPAQIEACSYIEPALANARSGSFEIETLADAFLRLEPLLHWRIRPKVVGELGEENFRTGRADTRIVGPRGLELHDEVTIGASLIAPNVTFPNHRHQPEEIYVAMSCSEWYNEEDDWYLPETGSLIYHRPNIIHAMRSLDQPFLAIWCLYHT